MKLKSMQYIFVPILSLFVMNGCGSSSTSDNQPNSRLSEESGTEAMYIPMEEIDAQKKLSKATIYKVSTTKKFTRLVKENAERDNIDKAWINYDRNPRGATMNIVYDDLKSSRVIEFNGAGLKNGYVLGYSYSKHSGWGDTKSKIITWSGAFNENYVFYVRVNTTQGYRYLYYTSSNHNYGVHYYHGVPRYIHHGLGSNSTDGVWRTFTRDLEADLKEFTPDNTLISVDGLFVRGSGRIDDVELLREDTTPAPTTEEAIKTWLAAQGFNEFKNLNLTVSTDKTRAVVSFHHTVEDYFGDFILILDTSDLNDIKELTREVEYSDYGSGHHPEYQSASVEDGKYILVNMDDCGGGGCTSTKSYYNYNTGKIASTYTFLDYERLIQCEDKDFFIQTFEESGPPYYYFKSIDIRNINHISSKLLYEADRTDDNAKFANVDACAITDRQNTILLLDNNGDLIQDFDIN